MPTDDPTMFDEGGALRAYEVALPDAEEDFKQQTTGLSADVAAFLADSDESEEEEDDEAGT